MYNNGLQDSELQQLHKVFKLNMNMFLEDILNSNMFQVTDKGEHYEIIPLFYCDKIETDGNALINGVYSIVCKKNYEQIFLFISENEVDFPKTYTIKQYLDTTYYLIFIYKLVNLEPCRNFIFTVDYGEGNVKQYQTDELGYCMFNSEGADFEVII